MNDDRIPAVAGAAYEMFETRERHADTSYVTLKDDAPQWLLELVRVAHDELLPDNWRYSTIRSALGYLHDNASGDLNAGNDLDDLAHGFADAEADVYTGARLEWLASDLRRAAYCDDAVAELGYPSDRGIVGVIGYGQYTEAQEVFGLVLQGLRDLDEGVVVDLD